MHFKYEKNFLVQKQSESLWPSADTNGYGPWPSVPEQCGPKGPYYQSFSKKLLSPKMPLQSFSKSKTLKILVVGSSLMLSS